MFVAGLSDPSSSNVPNRNRSISSASNTSARKLSGGPATLLEPSNIINIALTTPITSPTPRLENLPSSPPVEGDNAGDLLDTQASIDTSREQGEDVDGRDRELKELVTNLRGALTPLGGKGKVWLGERARKEFRIILVDKGVRLPMRKVNPLASSTPSVADPPSTPHSPLSPLIPSSPLYPDGLVAPVWVRKHAELVPSVFVLFLRLYESRPPPTSESPEEASARVAANRAMEKDQDDQLVREIGDRRRRLGERGIKLTVVLMASAATLDSPALDPRLSYLRRASALSAKASLFVLTPVPADQLSDFVQSLQDALYDSAMEYYSAHGKRVRRKRSRVPVSQTALSPVGGQAASGSGPRALGPQGWAVRYDWKAGWFAEVRGDFDVARRHYEDCWNELARMFSSTTTLPPRTKRWAEAKVLADCVAVRICKLLLYDEQGARVLNPFFVHLKRFGDLSRGWGIGEETFEFWSWIARQYRIFAELLELGQQAGLRIMSLAPPVFPTAAAAAAPPPPEYYATPISSGNPLQVLQQPAFYYYTAASCSVQRQAKFQEALDAEVASGYVSTAPGFANEKKVDHAALVIELFTKSYSLLKEQEHAQNRMALFVAFRIAEVYCQSNQYDMALRFFDRISQGFRRERWSPIVRQIRELWYECAQQTGSVETAARLLVEMMCPGSGVEGGDRTALQEDLLSLLKTTAPASSDPVVVDMEGPSALLNVRAGFWSSESILSKKVPYQVTLRCPEEVDITDIKFTTLRISYSDDREYTLISGDLDESELQDYRILTVGSEGSATLQWRKNGILVINGQIDSDTEGDVRISEIKLSLKQGSWEVEVRFIPEDLTEWITPRGPIVPVQELASTVSFVSKPHEIDIEVAHPPSAYIGEDTEIAVKITNTDDREIDVVFSAFLQPGDGDDDDDGSTIAVDHELSPSLLKDVSLGPIAPASTSSKTIILRSPAEGTKIIDISVHSSVKAPSSQSKSLSPDMGDGAAGDQIEEITRTLVLPVVRPFDVRMGVKYSQRIEGTEGAQAVVGILVGIGGPRPVTVEKIELRKVSLNPTSCQARSFPQRWDERTNYSLSAKFALSSGLRGGAVGDPAKVPAELVFTWRSDPSKPLVTTVHPMPPLLLPPPTDSFIVPTLHLPQPPVVSAHQPFPLTLTILNTHPTQTATSLSVQGETADSFVWRGDRNILLQPLRPGEERQVRLQMVALGGSGWVSLPAVNVYEGEGEDREEVRVTGGGLIMVRP
ncbi:hypothetical protein I317_00702 [Kwoniella heveanensis CBS 569]|nr:hypothetical protein I317_00702 [Kwoniella heveanensis CBS 569]